MQGVHLIAAVGLSGQLAYQGAIPWHGRPEFRAETMRDLHQFAKMTEGGVLLMGSVTAKTLPDKFVAGDRQVVQWRQRYNVTPEQFLYDLKREYPRRDIWICGGQKVYELFIPHVDWHHISVIPYDGPADRWLPPIIPTWRNT